jgi:hypothetical protein
MHKHAQAECAHVRRASAVFDKGRAPIRLLAGGEFAIGIPIEIKQLGKLVDMRLHSPVPEGGFQNGQWYFHIGAGKEPMPLDMGPNGQLYIHHTDGRPPSWTPAPPWTDWKAIRQVALILWSALYAGTALVRITQ